MCCRVASHGKHAAVTDSSVTDTGWQWGGVIEECSQCVFTASHHSWHCRRARTARARVSWSDG